MGLFWVGATSLPAALPVYIVKDINQTPDPSASSNPSVIVSSGGILYFTADDGQNGRRLWETDGTNAGTYMVVNTYGNPSGLDPQNLFDLSGKLFFSASEDLYGRELWMQDAASTTSPSRVKDIYPGPKDSDPDSFVSLNGLLIFRANDEVHGNELWKSDGTTANTELVADVNVGSGGSYPQFLTPVGENVYFRTDERLGLYGTELYRTSGNASGTILVDDIKPGSGGSYPNYFAAMNNKLYFRANEGIAGYELWVSDGNSTQTNRLKDIWPGSSASYPQDLITIGSVIYFSANDGTHGRELWKTDGTAAGTVMVKDILPGYSGSSPYNLFNGGGKLFFNANETDSSYELWMSDGTDAGTILLHTFEQGPTTPAEFQDHQMYIADNLVFPAYDSAHGWELWRSDGTAEGTAMILDLVPGSGSSYAFPVGALDSSILFSGDNGSSGRELWRLDPGQNLDVQPSGTLEFPFGIWETTPTLQTVTRTVTVLNNGWVNTLTFTGDKFQISGNDSADFTIQSTLPDSLVPGESASILIGFKPTASAGTLAKRDRVATLTITTDDPNSPSTSIQLLGKLEPTGIMFH